LKDHPKNYSLQLVFPWHLFLIQLPERQRRPHTSRTSSLSVSI
jgi:hypothetical protein